MGLLVFRIQELHDVVLVEVLVEMVPLQDIELVKQVFKLEIDVNDLPPEFGDKVSAVAIRAQVLDETDFFQFGEMIPEICGRNHAIKVLDGFLDGGEGLRAVFPRSLQEFQNGDPYIVIQCHEKVNAHLETGLALSFSVYKGPFRFFQEHRAKSLVFKALINLNYRVLVF